MSIAGKKGFRFLDDFLDGRIGGCPVGASATVLRRTSVELRCVLFAWLFHIYPWLFYIHLDIFVAPVRGLI